MEAQINAIKVVTEFPREVREIENVFLPLTDGCKVAARIWLPLDAEQAPVPAILTYLPYRKRDTTSERDEMMYPYFAGHGYACLRVDARGSGESDGVFTDEYTKQEHDDCLDVMAWIAVQPWCTGKIGLIGISWGGFNSLQVAARRPPQLGAVISLCSTDDRFADDIHYMGGCLLNDNMQWSSVMFTRMARTPDKALLGDRWRDVWLERVENSPLLISTWLRHQRRDAYWKHGSICEDWSAITCPVYLVGGWADGYSNAVPRMLEHLTCPKKGLIGPWAHEYPCLATPGPRIGFLQEALRWWDQWLKGTETGIMAEPILRVWLEDSMPPASRCDHRRGRWVAEPSWPSDHIKPALLYLNAAARLDVAPGPEMRLASASPLSLGEASGSWGGFGIGPELPDDQRLDDGRSLCFDSEPLTEVLEILGAPRVTLELAVDQPSAFVAVRLNEVMPDGASARISYGILNLAHSKSHESPHSTTPGQRFRVTVQLNDVAHAFGIGNRIRVAVSTAYWPMVWPSPEFVTLTLFAGVSRLELPVRQPRPEDDRLPDFPAPEIARPLSRTRQREPSGRRWVERDIGSGTTVFHVEEDHGRTVIDHLGLEMDLIQQENYSIQDDDPLSAQAEICFSITIGRGEWRTRTETRTVMRATKTDFIIDATLDAYEGETRIRSRNIHDCIPREFN